MKNAKRYLAVALSFALFLALPLAFTQQAAAASGTKVTQLDKKISVSTYDGKTSTSVTAYAYDKKGLNNLSVDQYNNEIMGKEVYAYNKSGYMTSATSYTAKDKPYAQTIYSVKSGKLKAEANYSIDGTKVDLQNYSKIDYKNGKKSKVTYATADGKTTEVATYKKGVLSQVVDVDEYGQTVELYDKYGNITSSSFVSKDGSSTKKTVYKNTYKNGKLVKAAWVTAWSGDTDTITGLAVYTYKKGNLVKKVVATTESWNPGVTDGYTYTYAYTKGGLIKTVSYASTTTTATGTNVDYSRTTAYQYKNVAVDKKCVKAVKAAMEDYTYVPGNEILW
jgi:hypothetical protein